MFVLRCIGMLMKKRCDLELDLRKLSKKQEEKIDDMQRHLVQLEQSWNQQKTVPSDSVFGVTVNVDYNVVVEGGKQYMNADHLDKIFALHYRIHISLNVVVDGLNHQSVSVDVDHISKKSAIVDDHDSKVTIDEENTNSYSFLSTQKVRELYKDIFETPNDPTCVRDNKVTEEQQDVGVSNLMDVDQPYLGNNVFDDVHVEDADQTKVNIVVVPFE
ncbi:hypothetical protein Tco_0363705 [Tanacetum coccineum]